MESFVQGSGERLWVDASIYNAGEDAFGSEFYLHLPGRSLGYVNTDSMGTQVPIQCFPPEDLNDPVLRCEIGNPLPSGKTSRIRVILQPNPDEEKNSVSFMAETNRGPSEILNATFRIELPTKTPEGFAISELTAQPVVIEGAAVCDPVPLGANSTESGVITMTCQTERISRFERVVVRLSARISTEALIQVSGKKQNKIKSKFQILPLEKIAAKGSRDIQHRVQHDGQGDEPSVRSGWVGHPAGNGSSDAGHQQNVGRVESTQIHALVDPGGELHSGRGHSGHHRCCPVPRKLS